MQILNSTLDYILAWGRSKCYTCLF